MARGVRLDLNEALQHPGRRIEFEVRTELETESDLDLLEPVAGTLTAVSTGNVLLVQATLRTRMVVECARCGEGLSRDHEFVMDEQFQVEGVPSSYQSGDYARVVPDEPYPLFEGNNLVLDAFVRQGLLVTMPYQPLCEYGWDGPCPIAAERGVVLAPAPHERQRLDALRGLLGEDEPS